MNYFHASVALGTDRARLHLQGELDMASAPLLAEQFEQACANTPSLILIDVTDLDYCDSSGIRALLSAAERCHQDGITFRVVGARGTIRRVFELTHTVELLHLDDS